MLCQRVLLHPPFAGPSKHKCGLVGEQLCQPHTSALQIDCSPACLQNSVLQLEEQLGSPSQGVLRHPPFAAPSKHK